MSTSWWHEPIKANLDFWTILEGRDEVWQSNWQWRAAYVSSLFACKCRKCLGFLTLGKFVWRSSNGVGKTGCLELLCASMCHWSQCGSSMAAVSRFCKERCEKSDKSMKDGVKRWWKPERREFGETVQWRTSRTAWRQSPGEPRGCAPWAQGHNWGRFASLSLRV